MAERTHKPVRVVPMYLPRELRNTKCSHCGKTPTSQDVYVVHVDRRQTHQGDMKAQSFLACTEQCRDELEKALTVEYSFIGHKVEDRPPEKDAIDQKADDS